MAHDFELSDVLPGSTEPIHEAWLSNEGNARSQARMPT